MSRILRAANIVRDTISQAKYLTWTLVGCVVYVLNVIAIVLARVCMIARKWPTLGYALLVSNLMIFTRSYTQRQFNYGNVDGYAKWLTWGFHAASAVLILICAYEDLTLHRRRGALHRTINGLSEVIQTAESKKTQLERDLNERHARLRNITSVKYALELDVQQLKATRATLHSC